MQTLPHQPQDALFRRIGTAGQVHELAQALAHVRGRIVEIEVLTGGRSDGAPALREELAVLHEQRESLQQLVAELAGAVRVDPLSVHVGVRVAPRAVPCVSDHIKALRSVTGRHNF